MTSNTVYAHIPYLLLNRHLEMVTRKGINPEIAFSCDALDAAVPSDLVSIAEALASHDLKTTIHAPFMDLNPGAVDPLVWQATLERFNQVLDAAEILRPTVIVFHPGYDRWRFGDKKQRWLDNSLRIWEKILLRGERIGCVIAVENIFEEEPSTLRMLLDALDSPLFRHCFDVGHFNLFARVSMEDWFAELGNRIAEAHIHDNHGTRDEHLPPGEGSIDFQKFFSLLRRFAPDAAYTLEAHDREILERAFRNLMEYLA